MFRSGVLGVFDEFGKGICGVNGVFVGNDVKGRFVISMVIDIFCNDWSDEFEDVWIDGVCDNVGSSNFFD